MSYAGVGRPNSDRLNSFGSEAKQNGSSCAELRLLFSGKAICRVADEVRPDLTDGVARVLDVESIQDTGLVDVAVRDVIA